MRGIEESVASCLLTPPLTQELLANSRLSVAEIAGKCAFNDSAYFCNLFKRRLGLSPSAWRQQRRGY